MKTHIIPKKEFHTGELYELPHCNPCKESLKILFEFVGKVGNTKYQLYQFKAVPGGWTVSLSPVQLLEETHAKS